MRRFLPGRVRRSGIASRFGLQEPWYTVVGVVKDVLERGYEQDAKPGVYLAAAQAGAQASNLVVRVQRRSR